MPNRPDESGFDFPILRKAIDSTTMLVLARFLMPVVVAIMGWFVTRTLDDLKENEMRVQTRLERLWEAQATTNVQAATLTGKVDAAVHQLDRLQAQVDKVSRP